MLLYARSRAEGTRESCQAAVASHAIVVLCYVLVARAQAKVSHRTELGLRVSGGV
jgi:hypothetical protein